METRKHKPIMKNLVQAFIAVAPCPRQLIATLYKGGLLNSARTLLLLLAVLCRLARFTGTLDGLCKYSFGDNAQIYKINIIIIILKILI